MNSGPTSILPPRLEEIIDDFQLSEGREKLELLLDFAGRLPALPAWLQDAREQMEPVPECMTPVFVQYRLEDGRMQFYFDVPAESPTVRGFAAVMSAGLGGATPEAVLAVPADFYQEMGLDKVLTNQRLNGITAILAHMKRLALDALSKS